MGLFASLLQPPPPQMENIAALTDSFDSYTDGASYACHTHLHPPLSAAKKATEKSQNLKSEHQTATCREKQHYKPRTISIHSI